MSLSTLSSFVHLAFHCAWPVVSIPVPNTAQCALLRQYPRDCNVYDYFRLCCIPRDFPWDNLKVFVALPTMNHWIKSKAEVAGGRVLWQCDSSGLPWFFLRLGDTKAELSSAQNCAKKFHTCVLKHLWGAMTLPHVVYGGAAVKAKIADTVHSYYVIGPRHLFSSDHRVAIGFKISNLSCKGHFAVIPSPSAPSLDCWLQTEREMALDSLEDEFFYPVADVGVCTYGPSAKLKKTEMKDPKLEDPDHFFADTPGDSYVVGLFAL